MTLKWIRRWARFLDVKLRLDHTLSQSTDKLRSDNSLFQIVLIERGFVMQSIILVYIKETDGRQADGAKRHILKFLTGRWPSSNRTMIQKDHQNQHKKWVNEHKTKVLPWPSQFPYLNPRKLKRGEYQHWAGNLKVLERFWMKEWSLISCQVFFKLISYYRWILGPVKLAKGVCKKYWISIDRVPLIVANVY